MRDRLGIADYNCRRCNNKPMAERRGVPTYVVSLTTLWENACSHLRELLHPDIYTRWIAVIEPCALEENRLVLSVDAPIERVWGLTGDLVDGAPQFERGVRSARIIEERGDPPCCSSVESVDA